MWLLLVSRTTNVLLARAFCGSIPAPWEVEPPLRVEIG
jgi:hypothetical protein